MCKRLTMHSRSGFALELEVVLALCEIVNSPRSLAIWLMLSSGEYDQYVDLGINPGDYETPSNFAGDYLVTEVLRKSVRIPLKGYDKKRAALDSFWESEKQCAKTNSRLSFSSEPFPQAVRTAMGICRSIAGPLRTKELGEIQALFRFGPKATVGVPGRGSVKSMKIDRPLHLTSALYPFYRSILGERWWDMQARPVIASGNKLTFVEKNAKTMRGIAPEPTLNSYVQLGIGTFLKHRLRRVGIDLYSQERNQQLASQAYSEGLATIDLSRASDCLSVETVRHFLGDKWFALLDMARSKTTKLPDGTIVPLNKFSSMGNGYTFELETLIFTSIAFACVDPEDRHHVSIYGDDIVVPQYAAGSVIDALKFIGFSVNTSKSFLAGNFFESCGTDWFKGQNVRPFYIGEFNEESVGIPEALQLANAVRLYAHRINQGIGCDGRFHELWAALRRATPRTWRECKVPPAFGDCGLLVSLDEARPAVSKYGEGWVVSFKKMRPVKKVHSPEAAALLALAGHRHQRYLESPRVRFNRTYRSYAIPQRTLGREPILGYLRKPVSGKTVTFEWPSWSFAWY